MITYSIKNIKQYCFYAWITFLMLPPKIIEVYPGFENVNYIIQLLATVYFMLLLIKKSLTRESRTSYVAIVAMMCFWIEVSNVIHVHFGASVLFIYHICTLLGIYILIINLLKKNEYLYFLGGIIIYTVPVSVINLCCQIIYGEAGLYQDLTRSNQSFYLCGNDNSFAFFYLTSLGCCALYDLFKYRKIQKRTYIYASLLCLSMGIADSTTGLAVVLLATTVLLILNRYLVDFVRKSVKYVIYVLALFICWLIVFDGWQSDVMYALVGNLFNENMNFISRGIIWDSALNLISKEMWIGYGTMQVALCTDVVGNLKSAHNTFLQIALYGGIPVLIIYLVLIFKSFPISCYADKKIQYIITVFILLFLPAFMFEQAPFYIGFYIFLSFGYAVKKIGKTCEVY